MLKVQRKSLTTIRVVILPKDTLTKPTTTLSNVYAWSPVCLGVRRSCFLLLDVLRVTSQVPFVASVPETTGDKAFGFH